LRGGSSGHRLTPRALGLTPRALALRTRAQAGTLPAAAPNASPSISGSPSLGSSSGVTWQPLGPATVQTPDFGLVTGRIAALALDPSDAAGNHLYVGTTGGGVWKASNADASAASSVVFTPLTDNVAALAGAIGASISIGALTVQPGTGVVLAGTGDPNDALDSYYGAGILRSTDGGATWSLIAATDDLQKGLSGRNASFIGNGFAGFAWSTANATVVVAAVSQAEEGALVNAALNNSYLGLYYSTDSGATWDMATISDGAGEVVQGPGNQIVSGGGNAATAVVWNPVRQLFVAAVRSHGYYQSPDGVTWTRIASQPSAGLSAQMCPANPGQPGLITCPIDRGALAVNPISGDTFAWTVDLNDQDQGIWQDQCAISQGLCTNTSIAFGRQWNTAQLENTPPTPSCLLQGPATICDGVYNLALASVPSQQDTLLMAGDNDLWKCSLAMGCVWRNTTNSATCMSAQVGPFQHAIAWNASNPLEIFLGNDSGLWRSVDAIGESGPACSASDASHFQNLNGSLGSLAEPQSLSPIFDSPYALMAGLGVNGFTGIKETPATFSASSPWPQIFSGNGGPLAIDAKNANAWYVNDQAGVAIYSCSQTAQCTPADFGSSPVVTDADVGGDGYAMSSPAPFLVDPIDSSQLLVGTCRLWRASASGSGAANAISPVLDTINPLTGSGATGPCNGDTLVRSMAAMDLGNGTEAVYLGGYGACPASSTCNGGNAPGHVWTAIFDPASGAMPVWTDLTRDKVLDSTYLFNNFGFGISSLTIDAHDATGNTAYATIEGMPSEYEPVSVVYRLTTANGVTAWTDMTANLPPAPANSLAVDPQAANTVYLATDAGVFFTENVANCGQNQANCWSVFGSGLPGAPAVALSASPASASQQVLVAATYGRGIWQTALWSSQTAITSATAAPANVAFTQTPAIGVASQPVQVVLTDTGNLPLSVTSIVMAGADASDFSETDNCQIPPASAPVAAGGACTINVIFTPQTANIERSATMTIYANVYGGQITVDLTGTGVIASGAVTIGPNPVTFGSVEVETIGPVQGGTVMPVSVTFNGTAAAFPISGVTITPPFQIASNGCSAVSAGPDSCAVQLEFAPMQAGAASGLLTFTDPAGTQTVQLTGTGLAAPTDILNPTSLAFAPTTIGQSSSLTFTITNLGDLPLTDLVLTPSSAQFQVSNPCGGEVAAQHPGICTITVQFVPTQTGSITGTLTVTDYTTKTDTQTISLSGTGQQLAGGLGISPSQLNFSAPAVGQSSAAQTVTITNSSGSAISRVSLATTGPFSVTQNTCSGALAAGSTCTASVVFQPTATGASNGALTAASPSIATPAIATLNGVVFDFSVGFSGPSSQTVAAGQQANYTLAICGAGSCAQNPDLAVGGSFTVACGTLPKNALCLFNPSSQSLDAGVQGNVLVQISTGGSTNAQIAPGWPWNRAGRAAPLACGLILLPLALRRRRRMLLLAVLAAILAAGVTSCTSSSGGGGSGGNGNGSTTPPGTYAVPVTVTSTGVSHAISLSLTVD